MGKRCRQRRLKVWALFVGSVGSVPNNLPNMQSRGVDCCTRKVVVNRMSGRSTKSPMSLINRKLLISILFVPDSCSP